MQELKEVVIREMSCLVSSTSLFSLEEGENMNEIYTSYHCNKCKKTTILLTDEVDDSKRNGNYLSCSHCGSKRINVENKTNDLRKCMGNDAFKQINGKIRQVRH